MARRDGRGTRASRPGERSSHGEDRRAEGFAVSLHRCNRSSRSSPSCLAARKLTASRFLRTVQLARAGLPFPAVVRSDVTSRTRSTRAASRPASCPPRCSTRRRLPDEPRSARWSRVARLRCPGRWCCALGETFETLRALGATAVVVAPALVCDKVTEQRWLGDVRVGIDTEERLARAVTEALARLFDPSCCAACERATCATPACRRAGQRMVDGMVVGRRLLVPSRHRRPQRVAGALGLRPGQRRALGQVPSDVFRVSRDGFVRDRSSPTRVVCWRPLRGRA